MKLIGLTGGIGMGKSTATEYLRQQHVPVIDTDVIARQIVEPGQPALAELAAAFGPAVLTAEGALNRAALAQIVFADAEKRRVLEAILHPRIRQVWQTQAKAWRDEGQLVGVVVIPLLFETEAAPNFNATICIACALPTQQERLSKRGWSEAQIQQRIAAQWPISKKMALASYVVWSEGQVEVLKEQLDRILATV